MRGGDNYASIVLKESIDSDHMDRSFVGSSPNTHEDGMLNVKVQ